MPTVSELQTRLDALEAAMDQGVRIVQYADRQITYRSLAEMQNQAESLRRRIGELNGSARKTRRYAEFGRGY